MSEATPDWRIGLALVQLKMRINQLLWGKALATAPPLKRWLVRVLRVLYAVGRDLAEGQLTLRAMSLVYTTLLSLVPLLALSFSVLKGFGVHNQVRPTLLALLAPLGEKGVEITNEVIGFVDNIRVGVLGALGLGFLIYTVTALLQKIELAFNHVWRVKRPRPFAQRFSQYLSVLMIGPVLVFSALGITATLISSRAVQTLVKIEPFGLLVEFAGRLVPYLLIIAAFTFIYVLIPNTRVRLRSALVGAAVAGVLWQTIGWGFAAFIAASTKYTAIYAGFAIVIVAMIWLYLSWLSVLIGASFSFYHQYPEQSASPRREPRLSNRLKEKLALLVMALIGRRFYRNETAWTVESMASHMGVPMSSLEIVLGAVKSRGLITETSDEPPRYLPARAFETTTIKELLEVVRAAGEEPGFTAELLPHEPEVESVLTRLDGAVDESLRGRTLRELVCPTAALGKGDRAAPS
jgi:membrane protein